MKNLIVALRQAQEICDCLNIPYAENIRIIMSRRMTSTFGNCSKKKGEYTIKVASFLFEDEFSDEQLMQTVIHELIHTAPGCMNHGNTWQKYAAKVSAQTRYHIAVYADTQEQHQKTERDERCAKYKIVCCDCGSTIYSYKKTAFTETPWRWHCGRCGGQFRMERGENYASSY